MISALNDVDIMIRAEAAKGLGILKDHRSIEPLILSLNNESRIVSSAAAKALIKMKATEGKESLFRTLETGLPHARILAADLIGKLKLTFPQSMKNAPTE